jgi:cytochrome c553
MKATHLAIASTGFLAGLMASPAEAQSILRGRELYQNTTAATGAPLTCASCHLNDVTLNISNIRLGANNAALIQSAVTTNKGGMGFYAGYLVAQDYTNLAAYIANPAGRLEVGSNSVAFGNQTVGVASAGQVVPLVNSTLGAISVTQLAAAPAGEFSANNSCLGTLAAGATCNVNVTFTPTAMGARSGTLTIASSASATAVTVPLSGTGSSTPTPAATLAAPALTFSAQSVGVPTVQATTFSNPGTAPLMISALAIGGSSAAEFTWGTGTTCAVGALPAGGNCRLEMNFRPRTAGSKSATATISHNAGSGTSTVALSGVASAPAGTTGSSGSSLVPSNVGGAGALPLSVLLGLPLLLGLRRRYSV